MGTERDGPARPVLWGALSVASIVLLWVGGFATRAAAEWMLPALLLLTPAALGFGMVAVVRNSLRLSGASGGKRALVLGLVAGAIGVLLALFTLWMFFTPSDRIRGGNGGP